MRLLSTKRFLHLQLNLICCTFSKLDGETTIWKILLSNQNDNNGNLNKKLNKSLLEQFAMHSTDVDLNL